MAAARAWSLVQAGDAPLVLGGDLNTPTPKLDGFVRAAAGRIDFVYARGLELAGRGEVLDAGALSDHRPIRATVTRP